MLNFTLAQINPIVGDLPYNYDKITDTITACPGDTDVIIFPELVLCGYPPEDLILKPSFLDGIEQYIERLCNDSNQHEKALLIGCPWRQNDMTYNAAHLIANGKIIGTVFKHHLPNYSVFDEQRVFTSGPLPKPIEYKDHKLGIMICEDMWYADTAQSLKNQGAEILIVPNGSPYDRIKNEQRITLAKDRVKETGLPLIYVNQTGGQDELVFDGCSFALDKNGNITTQLPYFAETIKPLGTKTTLPDNELDIIYGALKIGLHDYVSKNGFPGVLIGLSGGIDSALVAAIATDALGPDKVHCVMMPSKYTSQESLDDAQELANNLGTKYDIISIEKPVAAFEGELQHTLGKTTGSTTQENIQSRCRGLILMGLSNDIGSMVLSTGNKSEMAVGYATLYGDMCGGFSPLKDIYKTTVYDLCKWRNAQSPVIPENILTKAPTAELKPDQTDQDTLPPYEQLDDILQCLIENELSIDNIAARGHDKKTVLKVWKMLDRAEYKRRQAPPGTKITSRAFGKDRRYPITNGFFKNSA